MTSMLLKACSFSLFYKDLNSRKIMTYSSLYHACVGIFWQQNLSIKALEKKISNLNHALKPVLVLIRSWDVTILTT